MEISTKHQSVAYSTERDFALQLDQNDPLAELREQYHIPKTVHGDPFIYLCGNSLGLQPKGTRAAIEQELNDWAEFGVDGHFESKHPWYSYHEMFREPAARLVGAKPGEVVVMNTLTANLHLMMVSFYRPVRERRKILIEARAFPYACCCPAARRR